MEIKHYLNGEEIELSEGETQCPSCERDDFASVRGLKQHHTRSHGESITTSAIVECDWCGKTVERSRQNAKQSEHDFCGEDSECRKKWLSENMSGQNNPWWIDKVEVECSQCGTPKQVPPSRTESYDRHFCNSKCHGEWQAEHLTGEDSPGWRGGRVEAKCTQCGVLEEVYPRKKERSRNHFCSIDCRAAWQSEHLAGPDSPLWEGGYGKDYGPMWTEELREYIREKQNRQCADCGVPDTFLPVRLHVHHINPERWLNDWKINQHWNLVGLCPACHAYWEGKRESKQRMKFSKHAMRAGEPGGDEPWAGFDEEAAEASGWLVAD